MGFKISKHAADQMKLRDIAESLVWDILDSPDQVIINGEKAIYQAVITETGKQYLVRIFVNHLAVPNLVITVYKTSKINKYYEGDIR